MRRELIFRLFRCRRCPAKAYNRAGPIFAVVRQADKTPAWNRPKTRERIWNSAVYMSLVSLAFRAPIALVMLFILAGCDIQPAARAASPAALKGSVAYPASDAGTLTPTASSPRDPAPPRIASQIHTVATETTAGAISRPLNLLVQPEPPTAMVPTPADPPVSAQAESSVATVHEPRLPVVGQERPPPPPRRRFQEK